MVHLPDLLYERLRERAEQAGRTVEEELLEVVVTAVPPADDLPAELDEALSPLSLLDDESLWRAARSHLAPEAAGRLERLHLKRQREGLTACENKALEGLIRQYERAMLVRAQAAALIKERGYDVSELLASS